MTTGIVALLLGLLGLVWLLARRIGNPMGFSGMVGKKVAPLLFNQLRERVGLHQQSGDRVRHAMRQLSNHGWVLTSQSGNTVGFARDGLTLLIELEDGKILLSGTGAAEADEDLSRRE
jgi:hypothetical protein